jgi:colanic acid/amylovoran biosynthesis glycosyltransferase
MKKIAYLLHRFPTTTDTFIRREIRSLQAAGTHVEVISVWKPFERETMPTIMAEWQGDTHYLLSRSPITILWIVFRTAALSPKRFFSTAYLALSTTRPGLSGIVYQAYYLMEAILAADILRRNSFNHVHNHIGDQSGTVTMLAAHLANIGYSITFHGWPVFFDVKYSRIKEKVRAAKFTRAISYFCRSQLMMFSESEDTDPFKIVHCGLEIGKYDYRPPRQEIEWIFCAARLSAEKGLSFLLYTIKSLRDLGHDLKLRLAGDGPSRAKLESLAKDLNIEDHVIFLGFLTEAEITAELQNSDLFVLPSFVEGLPISAAEAMATGVPVIATNIAGTSELIDHEKTGLLVRPSDVEALVNAIIRMIDDHGFRSRIAELARRKVVDEFDVIKETAKLNQYLLQSCD